MATQEQVQETGRTHQELPMWEGSKEAWVALGAKHLLGGRRQPPCKPRTPYWVGRHPGAMLTASVPAATCKLALDLTKPQAAALSVTVYKIA